MITPDLQLTLFTEEKKDIYKRLNINDSDTSLYYKKGYLSYNISECVYLNTPQLLELKFIHTLYSKHKNFETINLFLKDLHKPYAYNIDNVYFNVFKNEWCYSSERDIEKIDKHELIDFLIDSLDIEDDNDDIKNLIVRLTIMMADQISSEGAYRQMMDKYNS